MKLALVLLTFFVTSAHAALVANVVIILKKGIDKQLTISSEYHTSEEILIEREFHFDTRTGIHFSGTAKIREYENYGPSSKVEMICILSESNKPLMKKDLFLEVGKEQSFVHQNKDEEIETIIKVTYR